MARFKGEFEEVFEVNASPDVAKQHFGDVERVGANYGPVEKWEKIDDQTIHILLLPQKAQGTTFQGEYTARYVHRDDELLEWTTEGESSMSSTGTDADRSTQP